MSFGILGPGQQLKRNLDGNIYNSARNEKKRKLDSFQTEEAIESGYVQSGMSGAGMGAGIGYLAGTAGAAEGAAAGSAAGPWGAAAGAAIGFVGGFLADYFL